MGLSFTKNNKSVELLEWNLIALGSEMSGKHIKTRCTGPCEEQFQKKSISKMCQIFKGTHPTHPASE